MAYAKLRLGGKTLPHLLWCFTPGTAQEDETAIALLRAKGEHPNGVASVSEECHGALADVDVIGDFPMIDLGPVEENKPSKAQLGLLREACEPLGTLPPSGPLTRAMTVLVRRGWVEVINGKVYATDAGRAQAGMLVEAVAAE